MIRAFYDWWADYWPPVALVVVLAALLTVAVWSEMESARQWEDFKQAHDCRLVGHMEGRAVPGVGVGMADKGATVVSTTTFEPDREGWLCSDGVTYWR